MLKKSTLLISLVILILMIGYIGQIQAGEQEIISSFENLVKEVEKIIKSFPETVVYRDPGYRKEKITFKSISYDIQKTDSLISPYKGIIVFETNWEFGPNLSTASQAERSKPNETLIENEQHQVVYAYQNNKWVKQYAKYYYDNSWRIYTKDMDQLAKVYFKKGYPYLSLFPKLILTIK